MGCYNIDAGVELVRNAPYVLHRNVVRPLEIKVSKLQPRLQQHWRGWSLSVYSDVVVAVAYTDCIVQRTVAVFVARGHKKEIPTFLGSTLDMLWDWNLGDDQFFNFDMKMLHTVHAVLCDRGTAVLCLVSFTNRRQHTFPVTATKIGIADGCVLEEYTFCTQHHGFSSDFICVLTGHNKVEMFAFAPATLRACWVMAALGFRH